MWCANSSPDSRWKVSYRGTPIECGRERQLCFVAGAAVLPSPIPGEGPVFLQDLRCSGSEQNLLKCDM